MPPAIRWVSSSPWAASRSSASARLSGWCRAYGRISAPQRLRAERRSSGGGLGGGQDALDDLVVARAAAEVARHPVAHLLGRRPWLLRQQGGRGDDLAGRADTALEAAVPNERVLQRREMLVVRRQPFDGGDVRAVDERGWHEAGADELAVDEDAAGAADADAAALPWCRSGRARRAAGRSSGGARRWSARGQLRSPGSG